MKFVENARADVGARRARRTRTDAAALFTDNLPVGTLEGARARRSVPQGCPSRASPDLPMTPRITRPFATWALAHEDPRPRSMGGSRHEAIRPHSLRPRCARDTSAG